MEKLFDAEYKLMEILRFSVETEQRLDVFLAEKTQKTRSAIKRSGRDLS